MVDLALQKLMLADLKKSGLNADHAKKLRLSVINSSDLSDLMNRTVGGGFLIPYSDFHQKLTNFRRVKLFEKLVFRDSEMRYWQPANTPPQLFIPSLLDWQAVIKDEKMEVWITEGEKKAAALCVLGVPCVAVPGVWAWSSKRFHIDLLPDLKHLCPRPFVLCFDSDVSQNQLVKGALSALAVALERMGGKVTLVTLPQLKPNEKTGLDDFIVHHKKKALQKLAGLEKTPLDVSATLHALNDELMFVKEQQQIFHLETMKFATTPLLTTTIMAHRTVTLYDRQGDPRRVNAVAEWVKWPERRTVQRLVYVPGASQVMADGSFNLWKGWGVEPKRGDTQLFDELIDYLANDLTKEQKKWWVQWLAYPLQHPGTKLYTSTVLYSHYQGVGKTLLGYTLGSIYGENYVEVDQERLHSTFNNWIRCKQFILGEEITGSDRRQDADKLKAMITREKLTINEKYQPAYELPDVCNYLLTTNQPDAIYLENTDRRNFIIEVQGKPLSKSFYDAYDRYYRTPQGAAAVFYKLLNLDLTDFGPKDHAPLTTGKVAMQEASGSEAEGVVREMLLNPKAALQFETGQTLDRDLFTLDELRRFLDPDKRIGRMQIQRALRKQGAPMSFPTFIPGSGPKRLYAVANWEKWRTASHAERVADYTNSIVQNERRRSKLRALKPKLPKRKAANGVKRR